ncbi:hypothetical protein TELCIR_05531, partial [Teladorsagia circumcincta]
MQVQECMTLMIFLPRKRKLSSCCVSLFNKFFKF